MAIGKSLLRFWRSLIALFTGGLNEASEKIEGRAEVVKARYEDIIQDKVSHIQQYKEAIATLIAQREQKVASVTELTNDIEKLEKLKTGAAAKAKRLVEEQKAAGKSPEEIKQDAEYLRCADAFSNFKSTLEEKQAHITDLEQDLNAFGQRIDRHKERIHDMMKEVQTLRDEAQEAVADILTASQEQEINDMLSGISDDRTSEELTRLRELRERSKAEAQISKELSGESLREQEQEFLEYTQDDNQNKAFNDLMGL